jgi:DNA mismatch repair protein MutS2
VKQLSDKVAEYDQIIRRNCDKIGALDLALGKAIYGIRHDCVKPEIVSGAYR